MLFQIYGSQSGWQLFGWVLVFACLISTNEIARRSRAGGLFFFVVLPDCIDDLLHSNLYRCCSRTGMGIT